MQAREPLPRTLSEGSPMNETQDQTGRRLLTAVERLLDDPENIIEVVERKQRQLERGGGGDRDALCGLLIEHYSDRTGLSGGLTALPAVVPGVGTATALSAGALADVALLLKYEVEMALALAHAFGRDITQRAERARALLLASVKVHDDRTEGNFLLDVAEAQAEAVLSYAPRQAAKLTLIVLGRLALAQAGKSFFRALPIVGVVLGASVNKGLTTRVGRSLVVELQQREEQDPVEIDDVVDAKVNR
jgi:uncharacterized protein (DUF697 family)